ncbi:MAG: hypothetical protein FD123_654 [Bacteroidetes bacterium]|nr:MAG: hypothetical protein FD123_654 [Bacteroidota bacterium]
MAKIESDIVETGKPAEKMHGFLSNFNNFESLMPEQITNWQSTEDKCTFTIKGMATIGMRIAEKTPHSKIHIVSDGKVPFEFTLDVLLTEIDANNCKGQLLMNADVNPFMAAMVTGPLRNFLNLLVKKMKEVPV